MCAEQRDEGDLGGGQIVKKRRSLKAYYGFVDVGYVAYARDMEHADELKTKIEALVYSVEGDANLAFVQLMKKNGVNVITVQGVHGVVDQSATAAEPAAAGTGDGSEPAANAERRRVAGVI